jgi:hypothetical protein
VPSPSYPVCSAHGVRQAAAAKSSVIQRSSVEPLARLGMLEDRWSLGPHGACCAEEQHCMGPNTRILGASRKRPSDELNFRATIVAR